jgi:hypothetical protein
VSEVVLSPAEWAAQITACWRTSVEAILEVGRLLAAAKTALPHGEFGKMIESELPFTDRTARMLMTIASEPAPHKSETCFRFAAIVGNAL